jgi:membrane-bound serine protease (ClpP class)
VVRRTLEPDGMVYIAGELWRARAESGRLVAGERVVVVGHEGLLLSVRRAEEERGHAA